MAKKKKKNSYGKAVGFCVIVGCVAALLWGAGNFGLGGGILPWGQSNGGNGDGNGNGGYAQQNNQPQDETPPQENENEEPGDEGEGDEAAPVLVIRVVRDTVYHGENQISIDELTPILEQINQPGDIWELHNVQAIAETFNQVEEIMRDVGVNFAEH